LEIGLDAIAGIKATAEETAIVADMIFEIERIDWD
jgi:hypothetical protein